MLAPFLDDPLFRGIPRRGLTGSPGLTDITFAGQRHVMPLRGPVAKATGRVGISQREEREMGLFSNARRPLMVVHDRTEPKPERKPERGREQPGEEPPVVHKPKCEAELYTLEASRKWDREHLAAYEAEMREGGR